MNDTIRRSTGAALLALLVLAAPSTAQEQGTRPEPAPAPAQERKPAAERPPADKPATDKPAAERQNGAAQQHPGDREAYLKRMVQEETRHRDRLAKIERLRVIAQQKGQNERLTQLGELLKQENTRFFALVEKARKAMDENTFSAMEKRLAVGRGRGRDFEPAAMRERTSPQRPDAAPGRAEPKAERPKDNAAERPKDNAAERPKDNAPERPKDNAAEKPKANGSADRGAAAPAGGGQRTDKPR